MPGWAQTKKNSSKKMDGLLGGPVVKEWIQKHKDRNGSKPRAKRWKQKGEFGVGLWTWGRQDR